MDKWVEPLPDRIHQYLISNGWKYSYANFGYSDQWHDYEKDGRHIGCGDDCIIMSEPGISGTRTPLDKMHELTGNIFRGSKGIKNK
jgi:hypothetical protein